ncbi:MAG: ABC transporter permease [Brevinematales bacterium]
MRSKKNMIRSFVNWFFLQIRLFFREPVAIFWIVVFPFLLLVIFGSVFSRYEKPVFRVSVYNRDGEEISQKMIEVLRGSGVFVVEEVDSEDEVRKMVENNQVMMGFVIPEGFSRDVSRDEKPFFQVLYNARQKEMNAIAFSILDSFLYEEVIHRKGVEGKITYLTTEVSGRIEDSYVDFLLPGLIALVVISVSFFSVGGKMLMYREYGILKQLELLPISRWVYVVAEGFSQFFVVVVQVFLLCVIGFWLYRVVLPLSFWYWIGMILYIAFGFFAMVAVALFVGGLAKSYQGGVNLLNLVAYPMMFLGGLYFPLEQMPSVLRWLAYVFPVTHFLEGLRFFFGESKDVMVLVRGIGVLFVYVIVVFPWVIRGFRWEGK